MQVTFTKQTKKLKFKTNLNYHHTLQIFTPWKLQGLGIAGSLQGKPALSMEKGYKNFGETP